MGASANDLMQLGMPFELAKRVGDVPATVVTAGTTAAAATVAPAAGFITLTTAGSQTGIVLPSHNAGRTCVITNPTATTGVVFPPVGATLNGGTATTGGQNLAQNKTMIVWYASPTVLVSILTA